MALLQTKVLTNASATPGQATLLTTTTGSMVFCSIVYSNTTAIPVTSITATGMTWTKIASNAGTTITLERWYAPNITGSASPVVSVAFDDVNGDLSAVFREYSGVATTSPLDKSSVAATGSSTTPLSAATATTTQANELVIGSFADVVSSQSYTAGTGYANVISLTNATSKNIASEDKTVSATGAQTAGITLGLTGAWIAAVDTFILAGGSTPTAHNLLLMGVGA